MNEIEPEIQHQSYCPHPLRECSCPRSHLIDESFRIRGMYLDAVANCRRLHGADVGGVTDSGAVQEWAIFERHGELHRGPWPEAEAREWLEECVEMGIRVSAFHLRCRTVGPWTRPEGT